MTGPIPPPFDPDGDWEEDESPHETDDDSNW